MGGVQSVGEAPASLLAEDAKFLKFGDASLFEEGGLKEQYSSIKSSIPLNGTANEVKKEATAVNEAYNERTQTVFADVDGAKAADNFSVRFLAVMSHWHSSQVTGTISQRLAVFRRVQEALARESEKKKDAADATGGEAPLTPMELSIKTGIKIAMLMLRTVSVTEPEMLEDVINIIRETMDQMPRLALPINPGIETALAALSEAFSKLANSPTLTERIQGVLLDVMLELAVARGSVAALLEIVQIAFKRKGDSWPLSEKATAALARLTQHQPAVELRTLSDVAVTATCGWDKVKDATTDANASIVALGPYLYISANGFLSKVGTGQHGTLLGHVYARAPSVGPKAVGNLLTIGNQLFYRPLEKSEDASVDSIYAILNDSLAVVKYNAIKLPTEGADPATSKVLTEGNHVYIVHTPTPPEGVTEKTTSISVYTYSAEVFTKVRTVALQKDAEQSEFRNEDVVIAINCAAGVYRDASGLTFEADHSFTGGQPYYCNDNVTGPVDIGLSNTSRVSATDFKYTFDTLAPGAYIVTLRFAELRSGATTDQKVTFNGSTVAAFTLKDECGGHQKAVERHYPTTVSNDGLTIAVSATKGYGALCSIVVRRARATSKKASLELTEQIKGAAIINGSYVGFIGKDDTAAVACYNLATGLLENGYTVAKLPGPVVYSSVDNCAWVFDAEKQKIVAYRNKSLLLAPAQGSSRFPASPEEFIATHPLSDPRTPRQLGLHLLAHVDRLSNAHAAPSFFEEGVKTTIPGTGIKQPLAYEVSTATFASTLSLLDAAMPAFFDTTLAKEKRVEQLYVVLAALRLLKVSLHRLRLSSLQPASVGLTFPPESQTTEDTTSVRARYLALMQGVVNHGNTSPAEDAQVAEFATRIQGEVSEVLAQNVDVFYRPRDQVALVTSLLKEREVDPKTFLSTKALLLDALLQRVSRPANIATFVLPNGAASAEGFTPLLDLLLRALSRETDEHCHRVFPDKEEPVTAALTAPVSQTNVLLQSIQRYLLTQATLGLKLDVTAAPEAGKPAAAAAATTTPAADGAATGDAPTTEAPAETRNRDGSGSESSSSSSDDDDDENDSMSEGARAAVRAVEASGSTPKEPAAPADSQRGASGKLIDTVLNTTSAVKVDGATAKAAMEMLVTYSSAVFDCASSFLTQMLQINNHLPGNLAASSAPAKAGKPQLSVSVGKAEPIPLSPAVLQFIARSFIGTILPTLSTGLCLLGSQSSVAGALLAAIVVFVESLGKLTQGMPELVENNARSAKVVTFRPTEGSDSDHVVEVTQPWASAVSLVIERDLIKPLPKPAEEGGAPTSSETPAASSSEAAPASTDAAAAPATPAEGVDSPASTPAAAAGEGSSSAPAASSSTPAAAPAAPTSQRVKAWAGKASAKEDRGATIADETSTAAKAEKKTVAVEDGSVTLQFTAQGLTNYAYKVTVLATTLTNTLDITRMYDLQRTAAWLGGRCAATLIAGTEQSPAERTFASWIQSSLFSGGLEDMYTNLPNVTPLGQEITRRRKVASTPRSAAPAAGTASPFAGRLPAVLQRSDTVINETFLFLKDLIDDDNHVLTERLRKDVKIKNAITEKSHLLDRMIRNVYAAILKHENLWMPALAFSQSTEANPALPENLIEAWQTANTIQEWVTSERRRLAQLEKPKALDDFCTEIIDKCGFLLQFAPSASTDERLIERRSLKAQLAAPAPAANAPASAAALDAANKLKAVLSLRKTVSTSSGPQESLSKNVMDFVKAAVTIDEMNGLIKTRQTRALLRVNGFLAIHALLDAVAAGTVSGAGSSRVQVLRWMAIATRGTTTVPGKTTSKPAPWHYLRYLDVAGSRVHQQVKHEFFALLSKVLLPLLKNENSPAAERILVLDVIGAEYTLQDAEPIQRADIPTVLCDIMNNEKLPAKGVDSDGAEIKDPDNADEAAFSEPTIPAVEQKDIRQDAQRVRLAAWHAFRMLSQTMLGPGREAANRSTEAREVQEAIMNTITAPLTSEIKRKNDMLAGLNVAATPQVPIAAIEFALDGSRGDGQGTEALAVVPKIPALTHIDFTVSLWVHVPDLKAVTPNSYALLSQSDRDDSDPVFSLRLQQGSIQFALAKLTTLIAVNKDGLKQGWNHVLAVRSEKDANLFLNGISVSKTENPLEKSDAVPRRRPVFIPGKDEQGYPHAIARVQLWDTPLVPTGEGAAAEVAKLAGTAPIDPAADRDDEFVGAHRTLALLSELSFFPVVRQGLGNAAILKTLLGFTALRDPASLQAHSWEDSLLAFRLLRRVLPDVSPAALDGLVHLDHWLALAGATGTMAGQGVNGARAGFSRTAQLAGEVSGLLKALLAAKDSAWTEPILGALGKALDQAPAAVKALRDNKSDVDVHTLIGALSTLGGFTDAVRAGAFVSFGEVKNAEGVVETAASKGICLRNMSSSVQILKGSSITTETAKDVKPWTEADTVPAVCGRLVGNLMVIVQTLLEDAPKPANGLDADVDLQLATLQAIGMKSLSAFVAEPSIARGALEGPLMPLIVKAAVQPILLGTFGSIAESEDIRVEVRRHMHTLVVPTIEAPKETAEPVAAVSLTKNTKASEHLAKVQSEVKPDVAEETEENKPEGENKTEGDNKAEDGEKKDEDKKDDEKKDDVDKKEDAPGPAPTSPRQVADGDRAAEPSAEDMAAIQAAMRGDGSGSGSGSEDDNSGDDEPGAPGITSPRPAAAARSGSGSGSSNGGDDDAGMGGLFGDLFEEDTTHSAGKKGGNENWLAALGLLNPRNTKALTGAAPSVITCPKMSTPRPGRCSYATSLRAEIKQHKYVCQSCDQLECCADCIAHCHVGHDVTYVKMDAFACTCGSQKNVGNGVVKPCCLLPMDYFEVTVGAISEGGAVAVGLMSNVDDAVVDDGKTNTNFVFFGYESSGKSYVVVGAQQGLVTPREAFKAGDVIGVGRNYDREEIFVTKNGALIAAIFDSPQGDLMPAVWQWGDESSHELNFGAAPFKFDTKTPMPNSIAFADKFDEGYLTKGAAQEKGFTRSPNALVFSVISRKRRDITLKLCFSPLAVDVQYTGTIGVNGLVLTPEKILRGEKTHMLGDCDVRLFPTTENGLFLRGVVANCKKGQHGKEIHELLVAPPAPSRALRFGEGSVVNFGTTNADLMLTNGPWSVEAWVRLDTPADPALPRYIVVQGNEGAGPDPYRCLRMLGNNIEFGMISEKTTVLAKTVFVPSTKDDGWTHVAGTCDGSIYRLYVDGEEVAKASSDAGHEDITRPWSGGAQLLKGIGTASATDARHFLYGDIAEFRFFNKVREPATIKEEMKAYMDRVKGVVGAFLCDLGAGAALFSSAITATVTKPEWVIATLTRPAVPAVLLFDPEKKHTTSMTISSDGTQVEYTGAQYSGWATAAAAMGFSSGVAYWEVTVVKGDSGNLMIGMATSKCNFNQYAGENAEGLSWQGSYIYHNSNSRNISAGVSNFQNNDVIGVELDFDADQITFFYNGKNLGKCNDSTIRNKEWFPSVSMYNPGTQCRFSFLRSPIIIQAEVAKSSENPQKAMLQRLGFTPAACAEALAKNNDDLELALRWICAQENSLVMPDRKGKGEATEDGPAPAAGADTDGEFKFPGDTFSAALVMPGTDDAAKKSAADKKKNEPLPFEIGGPQWAALMVSKAVHTEWTLAIMHARNAVHSMLLNWPSTAPLELASFGGAGNFSALLKLATARGPAKDVNESTATPNASDASATNTPLIRTLKLAIHRTMHAKTAEHQRAATNMANFLYSDSLSQILRFAQLTSNQAKTEVKTDALALHRPNVALGALAAEILFTPTAGDDREDVAKMPPIAPTVAAIFLCMAKGACNGQTWVRFTRLLGLAMNSKTITGPAPNMSRLSAMKEALVPALKGITKKGTGEFASTHIQAALELVHYARESGLLSKSTAAAGLEGAGVGTGADGKASGSAGAKESKGKEEKKEKEEEKEKDKDGKDKDKKKEEEKFDLEPWLDGFSDTFRLLAAVGQNKPSPPEFLSRLLLVANAPKLASHQETAHPYNKKEKKTKKIEIPHATATAVVFDEKSNIGKDFLIFSSDPEGEKVLQACTGDLSKLTFQLGVGSCYMTFPANPVLTWHPELHHSNLGYDDTRTTVRFPEGNSRGDWTSALGEMAFTNGVHKFSFTLGGTVNSNIMLGVATADCQLGTYCGSTSNGWQWYLCGYTYSQSNSNSYGTGRNIQPGDVIDCELNFDRDTMSFWHNGESMGQAFSGQFAGKTLHAAASFLDANTTITLAYSAAGSSSSARPAGPLYGYSFDVLPRDFTSEGAVILRQQFESDFEKFQRLMASFEMDVDRQLVDYVNKTSELKKKDWAKFDPSEFNPSEKELAEYRAIQYGMNAAMPGDNWNGLERMRLRIAFIQMVNSSIEKYSMLKLVDLSRLQTPGSLAHCIGAMRGMIFPRLKADLWNAALTKTENTSMPSVMIDRMLAIEQKDQTPSDSTIANSTFGQLFKTLKSEYMRNRGRAWCVQFKNEHATDAGGPYRESLCGAVEELHSKHINLFVKCPNQTGKTGSNQDRWIPNPGCTSTLHMQYYEFIGKLIGISLRQHQSLEFQFPAMIWKQILGEPLNRNDLESYDKMCVQCNDAILEVEKQGVTRELFADVIFENFVTHDASGKEVELIEGGANQRVTFDNRHEYVKLVEKVRLAETARACAAMRQGIAAIVPITLTDLFSWQELQMMVCGKADFDLAMLKRKTTYSGHSESSNVIKWFWEAMESFSTEERQNFLRFTWGRSRLPNTDSEFEQQMIISSYYSGNSRGGVDQTFPQSHTCSFQIDMPEYTNYASLRERLLYAITNCRNIDTDG